MEVEEMTKLNRGYLEDRQRFEKMIIKAKSDNEKLEKTMNHQKEMFDNQVAKIIKENYETKLEDTRNHGN